ncbi:MAG: alpha/beta fold hydrolase [Myxococcota bacterium]
MRLGFSTVLGLVFVAAALFVRHRLQQTRFLVTYTLVTRSVEQNAAEGRAAGLEAIEVEGQRALIRRPASGHDWVVYWGGMTEEYFRESVEVLAALGLPADVGVLIVAPPGLDSPGHPSPEALARDAGRTLAWLDAKEHPAKVVLASFSFGCFSVYAAAERPVAGAVMVGVSELLAAHDPGRLLRLRTPDLYERKPTPPRVEALVIQGSLDWPGDAEIVSRWLGSKLVMLPGLDHAPSRLHPETIRLMREFILARLGR